MREHSMVNRLSDEPRARHYVRNAARPSERPRPLGPVRRVPPPRPYRARPYVPAPRPGHAVPFNPMHHRPAKPFGTYVPGRGSLAGLTAKGAKQVRLGWGGVAVMAGALVVDYLQNPLVAEQNGLQPRSLNRYQVAGGANSCAWMCALTPPSDLTGGYFYRLGAVGTASCNPAAFPANVMCANYQVPDAQVPMYVEIPLGVNQGAVWGPGQGVFGNNRFWINFGAARTAGGAVTVRLTTGLPARFTPPVTQPNPWDHPLDLPINAPAPLPQPVPYRLVPYQVRPPNVSPSESRAVSNGPARAPWVRGRVVPMSHVPASETVVQPGRKPVLKPDAVHVNRPPRPGERERKFRVTPARGGLVMALVGAAGEAVDAIDAVYGALDPKVMRPWDTSPTDKLQRILLNLDALDWNKALQNLAAETLEDAAFGIIGKISGKAQRRAFANGYMPPRIQTGPADTLGGWASSAAGVPF